MKILDFPKVRFLLSPVFFDSAMTHLFLSSMDVGDLSLLSLGVEFVAYPCCESKGEGI